MTTQLFHVGCGAELFTLEQLQEATGGMAMSCLTCGARSPLVSADLGLPELHAPPCTPASLARFMHNVATGADADAPHLEYYLGYITSFRCPAKEAWTLFLRGLGSVSQGECRQPKCREQFERQVERHAQNKRPALAGRSPN